MRWRYGYPAEPSKSASTKSLIKIIPLLFIFHNFPFLMTIFSKIAAGEIPSYKCAENDKFYAFLDINPLVKGHTLVIPRREVDYIFDLTDEETAEYHVFAKKVAQAIKMAFPCVKVGMAVLGLEVPHAHIHLIPMQSEKDMLFSNPKLKLSDEEMADAARRINEAFLSL